jgi:cytochrome c
MKKTIATLSLAALLFACGGSNEQKPAEPKPETAANDLSKNPDYQKGLQLIAGTDCLTCHKIDEKLNGPSYRDVANKYAGMGDTVVTRLATTIIKGSKGVWGDVAMTAHPGLSQADAEAMVKYILLLKN